MMSSVSTDMENLRAQKPFTSTRANPHRPVRSLTSRFEDARSRPPSSPTQVSATGNFACCIKTIVSVLTSRHKLSKILEFPEH